MCQCRSWWGNTQTKTFSSMQQKPRTSSIISAEHTQRTETLSFNGDRGDGLYCNTAFTATSQRTWHGQVPPQKLLFLLWTMKIKQGVPLLLRYPCLQTAPSHILSVCYHRCEAADRQLCGDTSPVPRGLLEHSHQQQNLPQKATSICTASSHNSLSSGRCYMSHNSHTSRLRNSSIPRAITALNSAKKLSSHTMWSLRTVTDIISCASERTLHGRFYCNTFLHQQPLSLSLSLSSSF